MKSAREHKTHIKEDLAIYKSCARFNSNYRLYDHENALVYLKLRDDGCQKHIAKKFSTKIHCHADVTQKKDGPLGFKTLKVKKPIYNPHNGWANDGHHYDLGNKHYANPADFLQTDSQNTYFEEHFRKHELKNKENYKAKIESLKQYFSEINAKCNFTKLSKKDLYKKLRTENCELRNGTKWKDLELNMNFASQNWCDTDPGLTSPTSSEQFNLFSSFGGSQTTSRSIIRSPGLKISDEILDTISTSDHKRESLIKIPSTVRIPKLLLNFDTLETLPDSKTTTRIPDAMERKESLKKLPLSSNRLPTLSDLKTTDMESGSQMNIGSFIDDKGLSKRFLPHQDYAKYQKAYDELEIQNDALIKLTIDTDKDDGGRQILPRKTKILGINTKRDSNFKIAEEFNKMAYYYAQNVDNVVVDADSPTERKKRAEELMKMRKENRKLDKKIFDSIVNGQTQRDFNEDSMYDNSNLEQLKRKHEEDQGKILRKAGLGLSRQPSSGASTPRTLLKAGGRGLNTSRFSNYIDSVGTINSTVSAASSLNKLNLNHLRVPANIRPKKSTFVSNSSRKNPTRSRLNLRSDIRSQTSALPSIVIQGDF